MKTYDILKEAPSFKSEAWSQGYDAYWSGKHPNQCPYENEPQKSQWINGYQHASKEED